VSFQRRLWTTRTRYCLPCLFVMTIRLSITSMSWILLFSANFLIILTLICYLCKEQHIVREAQEIEVLFLYFRPLQDTRLNQLLFLELSLHSQCDRNHKENKVTSLKTKIAPTFPDHGTSFFSIRPLFLSHSGTAEHISIFTSKYGQWPHIYDTFTFLKWLL